MNSTEIEMLNTTLSGISLTDEQIHNLIKNMQSVFGGEDDFCGALELFLNFRIG